MNGGDKRLVNAALAGYIVVEIVVVIYICLWIARGY